MNKDNKKNVGDKKKETHSDLKNEPVKKDPVHKGYNEKNPLQPEGAFTPDSKTGK